MCRLVNFKTISLILGLCSHVEVERACLYWKGRRNGYGICQRQQLLSEANVGSVVRGKAAAGIRRLVVDREGPVWQTLCRAAISACRAKRLTTCATERGRAFWWLTLFYRFNGARCSVQRLHSSSGGIARYGDRYADIRDILAGEYVLHGSISPGTRALR